MQNKPKKVVPKRPTLLDDDDPPKHSNDPQKAEDNPEQTLVDPLETNPDTKSQ